MEEVELKVRYFQAYIKRIITRILLAMLALSVFAFLVYVLVGQCEVQSNSISATLFGACTAGLGLFIWYLNYLNKNLPCPFCGLKEASLEESTKEKESESSFEVYGSLDDSAEPRYLRCRACHAYARTDIIVLLLTLVRAYLDGKLAWIPTVDRWVCRATCKPYSSPLRDG